MLALYIVAVAVSGGVVGLFAHQLLRAEGYVPQFEAGILVAGGVACTFIALQLLYMGLVRLLKPTRSRGYLLAECLSLCATVLLLPQIARVEIAWPHPVLVKIQPLLFAGLFVAVHVLFKFLSFFTALRALPASRLPALAWLGCGVGAGAAAYVAFVAYSQDLETLRPVASGQKNTYQVGTTYAEAQKFPEGTLIDVELDAIEGQQLTMRWANIPDLEDDKPLKTIHVTANFSGEQDTRVRLPVTLSASGWSELVVPSTQIPAHVTRCRITWAYSNEPVWRRLTGIRPVLLTNRRVLFAGPYMHQERAAAVEPNFLIVMVDGLGASRISGMGYRRDTTPALDRFMGRALTFPNVFTPTPEAAGACMTLLTGTNPLRHGYYARRMGPLPTEIRTIAEVLQGKNYLTAAFTEGEAGAQRDLVFGSGFERGFEVFDESYASDSPPSALASSRDANDTATVAGSRATVDKVSAWLDAHQGSKFMVFVRLREMSTLQAHERYPTALMRDQTNPSPSDVYDAALAYTDGLVGQLLRTVYDRDLRRNTCIIVTSPYAYDFAERFGSDAPTGLTEEALRVPLFIELPGFQKVPRTDIATLSDIAPTMLAMAHVDPEPAMEGENILEEPGVGEAISFGGEPLVMVKRTPRWRLVWRTGKSLAGTATSEAESVALFDVVRSKRYGWTLDVARRNPTVLEPMLEELRGFLRENGVKEGE